MRKKALLFLMSFFLIIDFFYLYGMNEPFKLREKRKRKETEEQKIQELNKEKKLKTQVSLDLFDNLLSAIKKNDPNLVKKILEQKVDINHLSDNGESPLDLAIKLKHRRKIVKLLLKYGARVDLKNAQGDYPFHIAAEQGDTKIIKFLIKNQANINVQDNSGNTPLHRAVLNEDEDMVEYLIKKHADVSLKNHDKNTPLHIATMNGSYTIAKILLQNNAYVNLRGENGDTPLHCAVLYGSKKMVKLLVDYDADIHKPNNAGKTPLQLALDKKLEKIIEILKTIKRDIPLKKKPYDEKFNNIISIPLENLCTILYNNDEYEKNPYCIEQNNENLEGFTLTKANRFYSSFQSNQKIVSDPVGYFLYLPKNIKQTKAIIIIAYGGNDTKTCPYSFFDFMGLPPKVVKYLLSNNIGIMTLNTVDFIENKNSQSTLDEILFERVLNTIRFAYKILSIKDLREQLHEPLKDTPETFPLYLFGASFGGTTALRFAQKYPHTFNGYISHDGALAVPGFKKYLRPDLHVKNLQENTLIFQNYTDNIVLLREQINFYRALKKENKESLALLHFFPESNLDSQDPLYIGHFYSQEQWYLQEYAQTLLNFIEKTKNGVTKFNKSIQKMRTFFYKTAFREHEYVKKMKTDTPFIIQRFISIGFKIYKNALVYRDQDLRKKGIALPTDTFMKQHFETYKKQTTSLTQEKKSQQELYTQFLKEALDILSQDYKKANHSWQNVYVPIAQKLEISDITTENSPKIPLDFEKARQDLVKTLQESRNLSLDVMKEKLRDEYKFRSEKPSQLK